MQAKEKEHFNNFVEQAPKSHILQSWEWGELKSKGEWTPYRLLVENDNQEPLAAISILARRIPVLDKQIFLCPRGPVGDWHDHELMDFYLQRLENWLRIRGLFF